MVTGIEEISRDRLAERVGKTYEERQVEATELIADALECIRSEMIEMNLTLQQIAKK